MVDEVHVEAAKPAASEPDGTQAASSSNHRPVTSTFTRSDAPVIRNVRRGSATDALSSLHEIGESALVDELLQDRTAKSGIASAGSLLSTWHRFHQETFGSCIPTIDTLPVTVKSMVTIGAIYKRGGYRSFANYISAIEAQHIEAGFD